MKKSVIIIFVSILISIQFHVFGAIPKKPNDNIKANKTRAVAVFLGNVTALDDRTRKLPVKVSPAGAYIISIINAQGINILQGTNPITLSNLTYTDIPFLGNCDNQQKNYTIAAVKVGGLYSFSKTFQDACPPTQVPDQTSCITTENTNNWFFISNDRAKIGVQLTAGGAIGWFSAKGGSNIINIHDLGRYLQPDVYSNPRPVSNCGTPFLPDYQGWNPLIAGDVYYNASTIDNWNWNPTTKTLYIKTIPKQWGYNNCTPDASYWETWIEANCDYFNVRQKLTVNRTECPNTLLEAASLPAIFYNKPYNNVWSYISNAPFTNDTPVKIQGILFTPKEHWVGLLDDSGIGMGIIDRESSDPNRPGGSGCVKSANGDGGINPTDDGCNTLVFVRLHSVGCQYIVDYNMQLTWGNIAHIRALATTLNTQN